MNLDEAAVAAGVGLITCDEIDSTNADALRRARRGEQGPLWVTARVQSAGRGRRGRAWTSGPGNLHATLLLTDPSPPALAPQLSFVAALALHDAIVQIAVAIRPHLELKWPNDMLCRGAKLAGILVEGEGTPLSVAIGIGVNCTEHPDGTDYPATDFAEQGVKVTPVRLFRALSAAMVRRLRQWERGQNFATIRADWLERASGLGHELRVRLVDRELTGRFESLDTTGRLLLRLPDGGIEAIAAGDICPLYPSAEAGKTSEQRASSDVVSIAPTAAQSGRKPDGNRDR
ncbi:MAG: biotin--[acetyl-CoA-carboxylase] ligase [Bradyrhizobiaceae bacterium]|nr:biotin--[acetyl-CoA-carboxylase] ligase [Bradyrhizobiaceae bacterium]